MDYQFGEYTLWDLCMESYQEHMAINTEILRKVS